MLRSTSTGFRPIALPCAPVHARQRRRLRLGKPLEKFPRILRVGKVIHLLPEHLTRCENVGLGHRGKIRTSLCEEVPTK